MFEIIDNYILIPENLNFTSITFVSEDYLVLSNFNKNADLKLTSSNRNMYRTIFANTYTIVKKGNKIKLPKQIMEKINFTAYDISFTQNNSIIIKGKKNTLKL